MPISGADDPSACFKIAITGGTVIHTPARIGLMTPYILLEQEDWFEEETAFLRRLLAPGQIVIDIGANYGIYAASLAGAVGPTGRVLAIEPASCTGRYLSSTLAILPQAQLVQAALGNEEGVATLAIAENSETNHLTDAPADGQQVETVPLRRLGTVAAEADMLSPDFIKLDAEGAEVDILRGASTLLAEADPLILFERKHGAAINTGLIEAFTEIGYGLFQLLPGPAVLAPYDPGRTDGFGLNLFAVKPGRAEALAASGHLIDAWPQGDEGKSEESRRVANLLQQAGDLARASEAAGDDGKAVPALLGFARVSRMLGLRQPAIDALGRALGLLQAGKAVVDPVALPADPAFDATPVGDRDLTWLTAAAITAFERARNYSSYFADASTLPLLDRLRQTPHATPEILRRRQLMQIRAGQRHCLEWEDGFDRQPMLNADFWQGDVSLG